MRLRLIRGAYRELEMAHPFWGVGLTIYHWSHNLRVYAGIGRVVVRFGSRRRTQRRHAWTVWTPVVRSYPWAAHKSLALRQRP